MSHKVVVKSAVTDGRIAQDTCAALKHKCTVGKHSVTVYNSVVQCDLSIQLPGWRYPICVDLKTGQITFDTYNGDWGDIKQLDRFVREYKAQLVEQSDQIQEHLRDGWLIERVEQPNGDLQVQLYR